MMSGETAGSYGIIVEMSKAAGDTDITFLRKLFTYVFLSLYGQSQVSECDVKQKCYHMSRLRTKSLRIER